MENRNKKLDKIPFSFFRFLYNLQFSIYNFLYSRHEKIVTFLGVYYIFGLIASLMVGGNTLAAPSAQEIMQLAPTEQKYIMPFANTVQSIGKMGPKDIVKIFPGLGWGLGAQVKIWRAPVYNIADGNKKIKTPSWGLNVGEVIEDAGLKIGEQDKVEPAQDQKVSKNLSISITRVKETEQKETEIISYKTIGKNDSTLERGLSKTIQAGKSGKKN